MSCCSSRRHQFPSTPQLRSASPVTQPPPIASTDARLRFIGHAPMTLRGPFSGHVYTLSHDEPEVATDARDTEALLRTGLFERLTKLP